MREGVAYGGRGGAKSWASWAFARALLILGARQKLRILCARETQKSIADSVHALLEVRSVAAAPAAGAQRSALSWETKETWPDSRGLSHSREVAPLSKGGLLTSGHFSNPDRGGGHGLEPLRPIG
jgi:hypothetical protein